MYIVVNYGIWFDSHSEFSLPDGSIDKYVINFAVDMSSSVHIDNKKKHIEIIHLGIGATKGLDDTMLSAEAQYLVNFQDQIENFF